MRFPYLVVNLRFGAGVPLNPQMINMIHMIKISPVLATFWKQAD